ERDAPPLRAAWLAGERLTLEEAAVTALAPALPVAASEPAAELPAPRSTPPPFGLTPRELDVLRLLVEGRTDRDIADALFIGRRTVATHVANILGKLAVETRTAAAAYAIRHGLV
ncbi:MAG TPA: response regulator transcription factor, partial [Thermomicrobiales bacterium]|nr:response regulator transcription factor [Thermomicrobiales bacterium]